VEVLLTVVLPDGRVVTIGRSRDPALLRTVRDSIVLEATIQAQVWQCYEGNHPGESFQAPMRLAEYETFMKQIEQLIPEAALDRRQARRDRRGSGLRQ
jgi:hypothetical protein